MCTFVHLSVLVESVHDAKYVVTPQLHQDSSVIIYVRQHYHVV